MNNKKYAVVLCGGAGTRLWPLSRTLRPKQLLSLTGEKTLLQETVIRLQKWVTTQNIITVTHQDHKFEVKGQLAEISADLIDNVIDEPCSRNTLPAIALAVKHIHQIEPDAIIGVFPSDHAIANEAAFLASLNIAEQSAVADYLTLLGIMPTTPATGYGYIQPSESNSSTLPSGAKDVERFVEKPDLTKAQEFVELGYLWNAGIFIFKASSFIEMLKLNQPRIFEQLNSISAENFAEVYMTLPNLSIDYGLAEKAEKVAVVPVDMSWSDLGNWESIYQHHTKDEDGNVVSGDVVSIDTKDTMIWSRHGLLATLGVKDLVIIQTADATLVCNRSRTEEIKQLVAALQANHPHLTETHLTVNRPWGTYTVLEQGDRFKIKRIIVKPGASLSLQMHHHRSEHWVVVSGIAKVVNGEKELMVNTNQSTYIPAGHKHQLQNPGLVDLVMIEVQSGEYLGEDDIVRFQDQYGRC